MIEIKLTQGMVAKIDDEDFDIVSKIKWQAEKRGGHYYARGVISTFQRRSKKVYMHRLIMNAKPNDIVDHKNIDGLNNQRGNLRICTIAQNNRNRSSAAGARSKFLGVDLAGRPNNKRWRAAICHQRKRICIGHFDNEEEAAAAYNTYALKLHGEFARLNKIQGGVR
jgi:hypothetical protein